MQHLPKILAIALLASALALPAGAQALPDFLPDDANVFVQQGADSLTALEQATEWYAAGDYDAALLALEDLLASAEDGRQARLLLARAFGELGRYEEALERFDDPTDAALVEQLVLQALRIGSYATAGARLEAARAEAPDDLRLLVAAAKLELAQGRREAAVELLRDVTLPALDDSTTTATDLRAAGEVRWLRGDFKQALAYLKEAYRRDPGNVDARLAAAALYTEKYETRIARHELTQVTARHQRHPEAIVLMARGDFADGRYRTVENFCRLALETNPRHPEALEILAKIKLAELELHEAAAAIEEGLLVHPGSRTLRALRAALAYQSGDPEGAEADLAVLLEEDGDDPRPPYMLGAALDRLRRYDEAAGFYEHAVRIDQAFAPAANALGLLYMRDGQEEEARVWLDRGFELDRYNIRSYNMRKLLKTLDGYDVFETAHFKIKVDPSERALVPVFAHELEAIYRDLSDRFGFEPSRKTTIEIFPRHTLLSARLVGLPGVQGIPAACFGPVIATDSPALWNGRMNWRTIMAHEFGHTLALERTRKLVPHWFTEGLSVVLEDRVHPRQWDELAVRAIDEEDGILPFTELNYGFTRSKNMIERSLSYYKSGFAVQYLIDEYGWEAMLRCLDAYAEGLTTIEVIERELDVPARVFGNAVDQRFLEHVQGAPVWPQGSSTSLVETAKEAIESPDDPDLRSEVALGWLKSGEYESAVGEALVALDSDSDHALARFVLGHAFTRQGEHVAALEYLEPLLDDDAIMQSTVMGYTVVADLGTVYAELGEQEAAVEFLSEAARFYPSEAEPVRALAAMFERTGQPERAVEVLRKVVDGHPENFDDALELAEVARAAGRHETEQHALERALWIHPGDEEVLESLDRAASLVGDHEARVLALETLCLRRPKDRDAHAALVELCLAEGPVETARRFAPALLELDPDHPGAQSLVP